MKKYFIISCLTIGTIFGFTAAISQTVGSAFSSSYSQTTSHRNDPSYRLLPSPFPIFTDGQVVVNHPYPGMTRKELPTSNSYTRDPGCYIACYSHDAVNSVYKAAQGIYVNGQVRVAGTYRGRICIPTGFNNVDISRSPNFQQICRAAIRSCSSGNCWAGGDTGGWFGVQ